VAKTFPLLPRNPHRICWGCDRYCPADSLACGNGSVRTPHPVELFGEDWHSWDGACTADRAESDAASGDRSRDGGAAALCAAAGVEGRPRPPG
jgi:hypothetical protein